MGAKTPEEKAAAIQGYLSAVGADGIEENIPFVDEQWFQALVGLVVIMNTVCIGMEVDKQENGIPITVFDVANNIFCIFYVVELFARLYFHRLYYFDNNMNRLDFLLVLITVLDNWILEVMGQGDVIG